MASNKSHLILIFPIVLYLMLFLSTCGEARVFNPNGTIFIYLLIIIILLYFAEQDQWKLGKFI